MTKTLTVMNKAALRQKGWWLFTTIIILQTLFIIGAYLMRAV